MLRLTMLFMATTLPGTVATMATTLARGVLRLMLRLKPTMPFTVTIPLDMLPTPTSTCMERGVLMLMPTLTYTDTALATPTGPTMATTMASRGDEKRNRLLCLAALNKLVFQ